MFHMFFLVKYAKSLEEGSFRGRSADFLWMLLFGACPSFPSVDLLYGSFHPLPSVDPPECCVPPLPSVDLPECCVPPLPSVDLPGGSLHPQEQRTMPAAVPPM